MRPCKKTYYFTFAEIIEDVVWGKWTMKTWLSNILGVSESDLSGYQLPSDLTSNASIYDELAGLIYGRYFDEYIIKIEKMPYQEVTVDDINEAMAKWGYRFISKLNMTYEYYVALINFYRTAKANLMDDVESTSSNKIKFNDTPQNANTSGVYEGDDYINQFTKTEGLTKTQLTSKINRLREIQDGYKNVMADWVKEFEMLFMEDNH